MQGDDASGDSLASVAEQGAEARSRPTRLAKLLMQWGIPAGILAVLGYVLLSRLSPGELTTILSQSAPEWLLLGLLFYALTNVARAARMVRLLDWSYSRTLQLLPVMFALSLFNNVLPMRAGEFSFPYLMQQNGVAWGTSLAALLVSRLFDLLAVGSLFLITTLRPYSLLATSAIDLVATAAGAVVALLVLLASLPTIGRRFLRFLQRWLATKEAPANKWRMMLSEQAERAASALQLMRPWRVHWRAFFHSLLIWLGTYAWFTCFLKGIGMPKSIGQVISGASLAVLAKSLPVSSIGGFGAHEAAWTLGFVWIGEEASTAILAGFAVNLLTLLSSAIFGLGSLGWLALRSGRPLSSYLPPALQKQVSADKHGKLSRWQLNRHGMIAVILILFVALGTLYSVVTPLFETPDEVWHYLYVKHIADGGGLPVYRGDTTFPMRQEASQPPLYYLLTGWATAWIDTSDVQTVVRYNPHAAIGAPAASGNRNVISHTPYEGFPYRGAALAAHLVRFLSVLMGGGTVLCTYLIARRLFPQPRWLAPAAAALNAFLPQFIFISASINNDVPATLLSAITLWLLVCIVQDGPSVPRLFALGAVLGLAALSKLNALVLLPLAAAVLAALAWKRRAAWALVRWGVWTFGTAGLVGGWWYLRNWLLYRDPFGLKLMFAVLPARTQRPSATELLHLLDGALKSFFGVFGWFNIAMQPWVYTVFEMGLLIAVVGLLRLVYLFVMQQRWADLICIGLLVFWSSGFILALVGWTQARYPQGRLLFPAIPAIATLVILGLAQWPATRWARSLIAMLLVLLVGFAVVVPYRYIAPAYAQAPPLTAAERATIMHPVSVEFGRQMRLLGFDLAQEEVRPGDRLFLSLYWEALAPMDRDYSVFVHLVDTRGVTIAQRDSYPGAGNNPTRAWTVGRTMRDLYPLDVPAPLLAAGPCLIRVGLYDHATGRRLPVQLSGGGARDFTELPIELSLEARPPGALDDLYHEFEGKIALTGYSVQPILAQPGEALHLRLRWKALQTLSEDYVVFAHLMRTDAQIWAQSDHWPMDGQSPTSTWAAGRMVTDEFDLHIGCTWTLVSIFLCWARWQ
jgi:uncharacterized membrane protein YbhN (UPF0104 family)/4-amino-4-deoxy-L-arabinose transferase-like glycosyltransferase